MADKQAENILVAKHRFIDAIYATVHDHGSSRADSADTVGHALAEAMTDVYGYELADQVCRKAIAHIDAPYPFKAD